MDHSTYMVHRHHLEGVHDRDEELGDGDESHQHPDIHDPHLSPIGVHLPGVAHDGNSGHCADHETQRQREGTHGSSSKHILEWRCLPPQDAMVHAHDSA